MTQFLTHTCWTGPDAAWGIKPTKKKNLPYCQVMTKSLFSQVERHKYLSPFWGRTSSRSPAQMLCQDDQLQVSCARCLSSQMPPTMAVSLLSIMECWLIMTSNNLSAWAQFTFQAFKIIFQIPLSAGDGAGTSLLWATVLLPLGSS